MHGLNFSRREEIVKFVSENGIRILNLCHIPEDGRLRTLSFSATNMERVNDVLEYGERVDGSNLFSFIEPGKSDIYIQPRLDSGFMNPFSKLSTLNLLCDYLDENGLPLDVAPRNVLARAEERLGASHGVVLKALAELEFYIMAKQGIDVLFSGQSDRNYHDSAPFTKFEDVRNEILATLADVGIASKYGHSEVGRILDKDNTLIEQHEVEFMPQNLAETADDVAIAKWVVRNVCARHGLSVSFIPKLALEHAGTGMHIHLCALRKGENIVANSKETLSSEGLSIIGGILKLASSLSAFGNPTPISYFRFIAQKESPMHICWSAKNRLALIRIPLWWTFKQKHAAKDSCRETFEYRAPDAFANAYLLLAGITIAANYGLENPEEAIKIAENLHTETADEKQKKLELLPHSCSEGAENLEKDRQYYEAYGIFSARLIDKTIEKLKAYQDKDLWKRLTHKPDEIENLLRQYHHYG